MHLFNITMYNVYAPKGSRGSLGRKIQKQLETDRENKVWRFTFQMDDWIGYIDLSAWKMKDGKRVLKDKVKANDEMVAYDEDELCVRLAATSGCHVDGSWGAGDWVNVRTELK